jgi:diguanylate cyclase (GGDEF)-like protein
LAHLEEENIRAELQRLASTDPLTGVLNRRRLLEIAGESFYRLRRYHRPCSILVMDLDGFKKVNDTLGHQQGDSMLIRFAESVYHEKRAGDALGRMGGDEFCLVLPETQSKVATALAERILQNCGNIVAADDKQQVNVTVSIGISEARHDDSSLDSVFARADAALYAAKHGGRNRWETA